MDVIVLNRKQLESVLEMPGVIKGVRSVYELKSKGDTAVWPLVEHHFTDYNAVTDIRSGGVFGDVNMHGLKMLNNFPMNAEKNLPVFTGLMVVFDSTTGMPLGIMDASYITCMRTGAAGATGVRTFARKDSETLFVLGAGKQSIFQIAATLIEMPQLKKVYVADMLDFDNAKRFTEALPVRLNKEFNLNRENVNFVPVEDMKSALGESDVVITITPSRSPAIKKEWIKPGTHFSCIGADMKGKEEIDPEIFRNARVFCDDINQCANVGESEIPIATGVIKKEDLSGEIGDVLSGKIQGRVSDDDITIFDATGLALLDLVTAKTALQFSAEKNIGTVVEI